MLTLIAFLSLGVQQSGSVAVEYVRYHRRADAALVSGRLPEARAAFERCLELSPRNSTVAYGLACVAARGCDAQAALDWLERAAAWGHGDLVIAMWDEDLASVRGEARFVALIPAMKAQGHAPPLRKLQTPIYASEAGSWAVDAAIDVRARLVATAETSGIVRILDARSGHELRRSPPLGSEVWAVAFDDADGVAALTREGTVHLWKLDTADAPRAIGSIGPDRDGELCCFAFGVLLEFSVDGERLLVAGNDRSAALFTCDGELVTSWEHDYGAFFTVRMAWSPDGLTIATWEAEEVQFLDGRTGEPSRAPLHTPARIDVVAFHPGGRLLATGHYDARLRVFDLSTGSVVYEDEIEDDFIIPGDEPGYVNVARFSPDGRRLAYAGGDVNDRFVVEVDGWRRIYSGGESGGRMGEPTDVAWSPDGERLWCAFVSGPMPMVQIELSQRPSEHTVMDGRPPRVSAGGLAAITGSGGTACLDARAGTLLWHRPSIGLASELLQAPAGYFAFTHGDGGLEGLFLYDEGTGKTTPLAELVTRLLDPKRVRAARAGIALVPPTLGDR